MFGIGLFAYFLLGFFFALAMIVADLDKTKASNPQAQPTPSIA
jgi:hypothetical protein